MIIRNSVIVQATIVTNYGTTLYERKIHVRSLTCINGFCQNDINKPLLHIEILEIWCGAHGSARIEKQAAAKNNER